MLAAALATGALAWPAGPAAAQTVREVFQKVAPAVVVIRGRGRDVTASGQTRFTGTGSGVLVSSDGKVMTAAHVVHAMDDITVEFASGESVGARVIASEPAADLSLIKLERVPAGAMVARMADSDAVRIGDQVVVIGAPYGLSHSMTVGWISARWLPNTVYKTMPLAEFFQTDAVINQGNSGGPMFNIAGAVIGIVSHNISRSGGSEGLGFVVTIEHRQEAAARGTIGGERPRGPVLDERAGRHRQCAPASARVPREDRAARPPSATVATSRQRI